MAASIRELAQLGPMSPIGYGEGEDALLSPSPLSPGFPPGALSVDGRDDDSIWNWNNDVEKEREGERQSGELMFNHPSDVSAIDTDEEEAFARRNEFMDGMSEEDIYDESVRKEYSVEEERKVVRKFDLHLTLFMAVLYMLSFLDRSSEFAFTYIYFLATKHSEWKANRKKNPRLRYRQRQSRRPRIRSPTLIKRIRMGLIRLLFHIHGFRMDDATI